MFSLSVNKMFHFSPRLKSPCITFPFLSQQPWSDWRRRSTDPEAAWPSILFHQNRLIAAICAKRSCRALSKNWVESHWCAPLSARCCGFARTSAPSTGLRLWCASMEPPWLDHGAPKTPCGPHGITLPGGGRGSKRYKKCSAPAQPQTICQLKLGCRHLARSDFYNLTTWVLFPLYIIRTCCCIHAF